MAKLIVNFKIFGSSLALTRPKIFIDGIENIGSFSQPNVYDLSQGTHHLKVFIPAQIFGFPKCIATKEIDFSVGDVITVLYKPGFFSWSPGTLDIESHEIEPTSYDSPISTSIENRSIPDNCPHCKNPNTKRIRLCEWCGNQIC